MLISLDENVPGSRIMKKIEEIVRKITEWSILIAFAFITACASRAGIVHGGILARQ